MSQTNLESFNIVSLFLKDKDLSSLSLEELVNLYESTHEEVLEILKSKEKPQKLSTISKADLGL